MELTRNGAHDSHRHRRVESERTAEREHERPGRSVSESPKVSAGKAFASELHDRDVGLVIDRDDLRAERASPPADDRSARSPPVAANGSSTSIRVAFCTTWALVTT